MHQGKRERAQATLEYVLVICVVMAALIAAIGTGTIKTAIDTLFGNLGSWLTAAVGNIPTTIQ